MSAQISLSSPDPVVVASQSSSQTPGCSGSGLERPEPACSTSDEDDEYVTRRYRPYVESTDFTALSFPLIIDGVPLEGWSTRVETPVRITLDCPALHTSNSKWLKLPAGTFARRAPRGT